MTKNKTLPSPLTILMIVIVVAAICTWLIPAGQYKKLSSGDNQSFILSSPSGSANLPFT